MDKSRRTQHGRLEVALSRMSWGRGVGTLSACAFFVFAFFALNAMSQIRDTPPAKYDPNWTSLERHPIPKWFEDAKLGIFIHWGLYSVPGWAPTLQGSPEELDWAQFGDLTRWFKNNPYAEWYMNTMEIEDSPTYKHHLETYGANFGYLDFIPIFNREVRRWDPNQWAELFKEVGARYVVLTSKHHDGFTLWPSAVHNPHRRSDQQGSQRDIVGELTEAVRGQGLKMGLYYSGGLDWSFVGEPIRNSKDLLGHVPQSVEYARYVDAQWRELIERYKPSDLWNDISYPKDGDVIHLFADYYNQVPDGAVDDRFNVPHADYTTPEVTRYHKIVEKKWESCHG